MDPSNSPSHRRDGGKLYKSKPATSKRMGGIASRSRKRNGGTSKKAFRPQGKKTKHQFHKTAQEATKALMKIEGRRLPRKLLEPCCGDGAIVKVLRNSGFLVDASDVVKRGCPRSSVKDFVRHEFKGVKGIVTNPPYRLATEMLMKALSTSPYVAFLCQLNFLAGIHRMRTHQRSLSRIIVFSRRLPMMHRENYKGKKAGSWFDHAWFIFDQRRPNGGTPLTYFVDWREHEH